jgi:hypothetical protein
VIELDRPDLRGARDDGDLGRTTPAVTGEIPSSMLVGAPEAGGESEAAAAEAATDQVYEDVVSEQLAEDERRLQESHRQREEAEAEAEEAAKGARRGRTRVGMLQQAFEAFLRHHQGNNRIDASQLQSVLQEAGLEMDTVRARPLQLILNYLFIDSHFSIHILIFFWIFYSLVHKF